MKIFKSDLSRFMASVAAIVLAIGGVYINSSLMVFAALLIALALLNKQACKKDWS